MPMLDPSDKLTILQNFTKRAMSTNPNSYRDSILLPKNIIEFIKQEFDEKLLTSIAARYDLSEKLEKSTLNLNDWRMLIIGIYINDPNKLLINLFTPALIDEIAESGLSRSILNTSTRQPSEINAQISKDANYFYGQLGALINSLAKCIKEPLNNYTSTYFINKNFLKDLKMFDTLITFKEWRIVDTDKYYELQPFASGEYLFHNLARHDLQENQIISVLEDTGEIKYYKVAKLIDNKEIRGFALVPKEYSRPYEIKVVFSSNDSLLNEATVSDGFSNVALYNLFNKHKELIFRKLDDIISRAKTSLDAQGVDEIRLNIGGHGSGGALAQLLMSSLVVYKSAIEYLLNKDGLDSILKDNIKEQYNFETDLQNAKVLQKDYSHYEETVMRHLLQAFTEAASFMYDTELRYVNNLTLTTVSSSGIPKEYIRNNFIQALRLLHKINRPVNIESRATISDGNPIQQIGKTDLSAYVPDNLMKVFLLKITQDTTVLSSLTPSFEELVATSGAAFLIPKALGINSYLPENLGGFAPLFSFIINMAINRTYQAFALWKDAHNKFYLNADYFKQQPKQDVNYEILNNQDPVSTQYLNALLTHKINMQRKPSVKAVKKGLKTATNLGKAAVRAVPLAATVGAVTFGLVPKQLLITSPKITPVDEEIIPLSKVRTVSSGGGSGVSKTRGKQS